LVYFYTGQYDKGLKQINEAHTDWANAQGRDSEDHEFAKFLNGVLLYQLQNWDGAEVKLIRAKELFNRIEGGNNAWNIIIVSMLGGAACHQGNLERGLSEINRVHSEDSINRVAPLMHKSKIYEAIAVCQYKSGNNAEALKLINKALEVFDMPGYALVHANRKILKADILTSLNRFEDAVTELENARQLFFDVGLNNHPHLNKIDRADNELLAEIGAE